MLKGNSIVRRADLTSATRFISYCFCCFFISVFFSFQTLHGQEATQTGNPFQGILNAIAENEAVLEKYPDHDFTPNIMFQLTELYVKRARYEFQKQMQLFEEDEKKYDQGLITKEPVSPKINFGDAINMGFQLLEKYPNVAFRDKLMYRIAVCHLEQGDKDKTIEYLENLSAQTTEKKFLEESYFRLGEHYFDQKKYHTAIEYYRRLINSWDSPYFDMALYKLGWAYYNIDDYAQAISTLIYLIDDISLLEEVDVNLLGKSNADLRNEAIDYVAVCFADYNGPEKARLFLKDRTDKDYTEQILLKLAAVYQKRNYYDDAIVTLGILLDLFPYKQDAPKYQKIIVENYELSGEKERAHEARARFVAKYGPGSRWFQAIKDDSLRQNTIAVSEEFLYILGSEAQAKAQQSGSKLHYGLALNRYESYLQKFPNSERASKVRFYLSECLFEMGRYHAAADSYNKLLTEYPDSEFRETAAYNRVLSYNKMLMSNGHSAPTIISIKNFLGLRPERVDTVKAMNHPQAQFMLASNDYVSLFADSQKLPGVLMKYAQILYELSEFDLAKLAYKRVIDHPAEHSFLPQAYSMIAQCSFKQENFEESEDWFRKLAQQFPDSARYVNKAQKMIASSQFKAAESYLAAGDSAMAAREFENVAGTVTDPEVAERALFEAALLYDNIGKVAKAIAIYETISMRFPDSPHVDNSLFKAGVLSENQEDWRRAAHNYMALFRHNPSSEFAEKSLLSAARCYEYREDYEQARSSYQQYLQTFPNDPDRYLEAAFKKGEIAYQQHKYSLARRDFEFVISAYRNYTSQNRSVEKYIPANAQFLIAEILFDNFRNIKLIEPLQRNLKRKRATFKLVIKAYAGAAKFKVADWAIASSHKIGITFEDFANALLDAPRPANLSGVELVNYDKKLWESVLPFKKKALKTYQSNVKQARENDIQNQWVLESAKRMQALTAELGLAPMKMGHESGS